MNKETQESEAMGSEAAVLRLELEAAQAELCNFYDWLQERKDYKLECIQLRAEVKKLKQEALIVESRLSGCLSSSRAFSDSLLILP